MKTKNLFKMFILTLSVLLIATFSLAADQKVTLKPGPDGRGASGEAVISDTGAGQKKIDITVRGLKPDVVYTVLFVNMKPKMDMAGLGTPDYVIQPDRKGSGIYGHSSCNGTRKVAVDRDCFSPDRRSQGHEKNGYSAEGGTFLRKR